MHDFDTGGQSLWDAITAEHELDQSQRVQLVEACRQKDRLDHLERLGRSADAEGYAEIVRLANQTSNQMKQLLAALRLPDASGKRPQYRGPRGVQAPTVPGGNVSSIDRARQRKKA